MPIHFAWSLLIGLLEVLGFQFTFFFILCPRPPDTWLKVVSHSVIPFLCCPELFQCDVAPPSVLALTSQLSSPIRKPLPACVSWRSSSNFPISGLTPTLSRFRFSVREIWCDFLYLDVHLPQHFVEEALLPPVIFLAPLSKVRWLQMCGVLHGSSVGSCWSGHPLSRCVYHQLSCIIWDKWWWYLCCCFFYSGLAWRFWISCAYVWVLGLFSCEESALDGSQ